MSVDTRMPQRAKDEIAWRRYIELPSQIKDMVTEEASAACVRPIDIMGERRHSAVAQARHRVWLRARELHGCSYPYLGKLFGRDHTTVISGVRQAQERAAGAA